MLDDFGNRLGQARQDGTNAAINLSLVPDETSAENVQDAANLAYGGTPFGYKIGATSEVAQEMLAAPGPFFGVMVDIDRYDDGETIAWKDHYRGVECEYAFQMASDYPLPGQDVSRNDLIEAIAQAETIKEHNARAEQDEDNRRLSFHPLGKKLQRTSHVRFGP